MAIQIKRLSAPKISSDGESVKFTAHVVKGAALTAVFPLKEISSLIEFLIAVTTSAKLNEAAAAQGKETYGTKEEGDWLDAPDVVLVKNFQTVDKVDTGGFVLRLQDIHGRVTDVSFQPDHVQALKKMIDENENSNPAPKLH